MRKLNHSTKGIALVLIVLAMTLISCSGGDPATTPTALAADTAAPVATQVQASPTATLIVFPTFTQDSVLDELRMTRTAQKPTVTKPLPTLANTAVRLLATTAPTAKPVVVQPTAPPAASGCPQGCMQESATCKIKGNISSDKEKIYHVPGGGSYTATKIDPSKGERWFCTEAEAQANGWRRAKN